jgi:arylformamidase
MLNKDLSAYCVQPLVAEGIRVVIVGYELCPKITLLDLTRQIQKAGKHLLEFAASSGSRIAFGGHSAGAHLAISMLSPDFLKQTGDNLRFLTGVFLISGVYDLLDLCHTEEANKGNLLGLYDDIVEALSPLHQRFGHLMTLDIGIFVHVAANDSPTFINQSEAMAQLLRMETNLKVEYRLVPALDHFDIVENLSQADFEITKCIVKNLH